MIRIRASVILRVLDGFTGRPPAPSAILWTLDGQPCRPVAKDNGYYVLTDLSPGEHQLVLRGGGYLDERLTVRCDGDYREVLVSMKPGSRYPFGRAVTWLTVRCRPGQRIWMAARSGAGEIRIAQDVIEAGETAGRLFFPAGAAAMTLPGDLLVRDGERSEICRLEEMEEPRFTWPLHFAHRRSCCLYPAQCYTADSAGVIRAVFREPVPVELLTEEGKAPVTLELAAGENEHVLAI